MAFGLIVLIALITAADRPIGYAESVTGGEGGQVILVTTRDELKAALKVSGKAIVIVTQDITIVDLQGKIAEKIVDKTLLGLPGVKIITTIRENEGGIINFHSGSNNVIIRNLIFEGPGAYDIDAQDLITNSGCTNLWVDHCEFYDGVDGNFDNVDKADNITISWCKFGYKIPPETGGSGGSDDHRFSNLVGGSSTAHPDDGHYSITFHYCWWADGCRERMPRARNAELHILNCYWNTDVPESLALGLEGGSYGLSCYVEGSHFKKIGSIYKSYDKNDSKEQGHTLTFVDCLATLPLPENIGVAPRPSYSYSVLPVKDVEAAVTKGAGANLKVSMDGVVG